MLLSPKEDFKNRTLKAFHSLLEKLAYVCTLRDKDGNCLHWGLVKLLGLAKANEIMCGIHGDLALEATRLSIRDHYRQYESTPMANKTPLELRAPSNGDELLSDHLQLIQDSVAAIAAAA